MLVQNYYVDQLRFLLFDRFFFNVEVKKETLTPNKERSNLLQKQ